MSRLANFLRWFMWLGGWNHCRPGGTWYWSCRNQHGDGTKTWRSLFPITFCGDRVALHWFGITYRLPFRRRFLSWVWKTGRQDKYSWGFGYISTDGIPNAHACWLWGRKKGDDIYAENLKKVAAGDHTNRDGN